MLNPARDALLSLRAKAVQHLADLDAILLPDLRSDAVQSTATAAQTTRLIDALRLGPKTTTQLRDEFNVFAPSQRVTDARKCGWPITSERVTVVDAQGRQHQGIALYTLNGERQQ